MNEVIKISSKPFLKPCPFCGGEASLEEISGYYHGWSVGCSDEEGNCYGYQSHQSFARKKEAIEAWNKRSNECTCKNAKEIDVSINEIEGNIK